MTREEAWMFLKWIML